MPQTINVPGVGALQFPDGMSDQDMAAAIQKNFPQIHGTQPVQQQQAPRPRLGDRATPGSISLPLAADRLESAGKGALDTFAAATGDSPQAIQSRDSRLGITANSPVSEAVGGFLAGGAVPGSLPGAAGGPAAAAADTLYQKAVGILKAAGVRMDAAQLSPGSKVATTLKNAVADSPGISMRGYQEQQAQDYTRAVLKTVGVDSGEASPQVLDKARTAIKATLDRVEGGYDVDVTKSGLLQNLVKFRAEANDLLTESQFRLINTQLKDILTRAGQQGGQIGADQFAVIRRNVQDLEGSSDSDVARYATRLKSVMQDALGASITNPDDAKAYQNARTMYRRLKQIEPAINDADQIPPAALWRSIDKVANTNQVIYGKGDQALSTLAQAGSQVLGKGTANSGTAQRVLGTTALVSGAAAIEELYNGRPENAIKLGLLTFGGPALARYAVTHPEAGPALARLVKQGGRAAVPTTAAVNAAQQPSASQQ